MEEDIKVLEELIEQYNASYPEEREWVAIYPNQIQAIENLIARNKELEEIIDTLNEGIENHFIPKSKVREKIEEANKEIKQMEQDDIGIGFTLGNRWSDLKAKVKGWEELLQEGDK